MAVEPNDAPNESVDSFHSTINFTSASDRWIYVLIAQSTETSLTIPSDVQLGGVSATFTEGNDSTSTKQCSGSVWGWNEADIAAMTGGPDFTLSVVGASQAGQSSVWWSVKGAAQGDTAHTSGTAFWEDAPSSGATTSFARAAGGYTGVWFVQDSSNLSWSLADPTHEDQTVFATNFSYGFGRETSVSETTTCSFTSSFQRDVEISGWNIGPSNPPDPGSISYDIGWT